MQKIVLLAAVLCVTGAAAFAPSTLSLRLKVVNANNNIRPTSSRRIPQQQTKMTLNAASISLPALSEHFATSQMLVSANIFIDNISVSLLLFSRHIFP